MFELLRLAVALLATFGIGVWDLKTTDVSGKVVFLLMALGLALGAVEGVISGGWDAFLASAVVIVAFGLFGLLLYYTGAWGDGDSALLVAVGSLLPAWPLPTAWSFFPFPLAYLASVFMVGAFYSFFYILVVLRRSAAARHIFGKKFRSVVLSYAPIAVLLVVFVPLLPALLSFLLAAVLLVAPAAYAASEASEKAFYRTVRTKDLRPGDMLGEDLRELKMFKRPIRGLTEKQISAIRKVRRSVLLRDGVRYTMVFFLALLAVLVSANL